MERGRNAERKRSVSFISYTYAKAFKESFSKEEPEVFFTVVEELSQLNEALSSPEIKTFFLSPIILVEKKKQVLKKVFTSFKCNTFICSFLFLLLDKNRWKELNSILICLKKIVDDMRGYICVEVETVKPLSAFFKKELVEKISPFFNKKIFLKEIVSSKKCIGGLKIRAGGFVFDDTLLFHLKQMENQVRRSFYES